MPRPRAGSSGPSSQMRSHASQNRCFSVPRLLCSLAWEQPPLPHACEDFVQGQLLEVLHLPALPMVVTCLPVLDISNSSVPY